MRHAADSRTQAVTLLWIILLPVTAGMGVAWLLHEGTPGWPRVALLPGVGPGLLLVPGDPTVEMGEGRIEWRYGLLGWPRWSLALDRVAQVEVTTSSALESWGLRRTRTGMLYNAHGRQAVRGRLHDGRILRLGSDEPERLAGFVAARLPGSPSDRPRPR